MIERSPTWHPGSSARQNSSKEETYQPPRLHTTEFNRLKQKEIGNGIHGKVLSIPWRDKVVAVKFLYGIDINEEAKMLSKISHKRIVDFFGIVTIESRDCVVTELANLGSLSGILYTEPPPEFLNDDLCFNWTLDIAEGLDYLHNQLQPGISHGDLKSNNVLIFDAGGEDRAVAKICDLNTSRCLERSVYIRKEESLYWSAPEILAWETHSLLSDVWSFGVTVVEIFTKQKPYSKCNSPDVLKDVKDGLITPMDNLSEEQKSRFPEVILNFLPKCFMFDQEQRIDILTIKSCLSAAQRTRPAGIQMGETIRMAEFHVFRWSNDTEFPLILRSPVLGKDLRSAIAEKLELHPSCFKVVQVRMKRKKTGEDLLFIPGENLVNLQGTIVDKEEAEQFERVEIEDKAEVLSAIKRRVTISVFSV